MTQTDLFKQKIDLLKVALPSEYRVILENLYGTFSEAISEERRIAQNYWIEIIDGKEKFVKFDIPNGKLYKISAINVDSAPPNATITCYLV